MRYVWVLGLIWFVYSVVYVRFGRVRVVRIIVIRVYRIRIFDVRVLSFVMKEWYR